MVSDSELVNRLREILRSSDLDTVTVNSVRRQLEEEFGVDLHDRKSFLRQQIDGFLNTHFAEPPNDDVQGDPDDGSTNEEMEEGIQNEKQEEKESSGLQEEEKDDEKEEVRSKKKRSHKVDKNEKKKRSGFSKPCAISPQLQEIVGVPEMARTEVVKKMWAYIREKNLQNPKDKRKIICDETLHRIFQVKSINMFQMNKALSKHIWPIDAEDDAQNDGAPKHLEDQEEEEDSSAEEAEEEESNAEESENVKQEVNEENGSDKEEEESNGVRSKEKRSQKKDKNKNKRGSGFAKPCQISPQLQEIVGEPVMARTEVVKKIWAYIREKELQNPKDKRKIICDEKLRGIFRVNTINMFQMNKELSKHIWPIDAEDSTHTESSQKARQRKKSREEGVDDPKQKEKQQKGRTSG